MAEIQSSFLLTFDQNGFLVLSADGDLFDDLGGSEFIGGEIFESRDNVSSGGKRDEFDLLAAHPADGREVLAEEEVISFIVEAPLAENDVGAGLLDAFDHIFEVFLLLCQQLLVRIRALDGEFMFSLWLRLQGGIEGEHWCVGLRARRGR